MYSDAFLRRYARDRMNELHEEAVRARLVPSRRTRLALALQALATRPEPNLEGSAARHASDLAKALEGRT